MEGILYKKWALKNIRFLERKLFASVLAAIVTEPIVGSATQHKKKILQFFEGTINMNGLVVETQRYWLIPVKDVSCTIFLKKQNEKRLLITSSTTMRIRYKTNTNDQMISRMS